VQIQRVESALPAPEWALNQETGLLRINGRVGNFGLPARSSTPFRFPVRSRWISSGTAEPDIEGRDRSPVQHHKLQILPDPIRPTSPADSQHAVRPDGTFPLTIKETDYHDLETQIQPLPIWPLYDSDPDPGGKRLLIDPGSPETPPASGWKESGTAG